jgi:hypothetical protein
MRQAPKRLRSAFGMKAGMLRLCEADRFAFIAAALSMTGNRKRVGAYDARCAFARVMGSDTTNLLPLPNVLVTSMWP